MAEGAIGGGRKGLPRHRCSGAQMRFVEVIHIKSSVFMPRHRRDRAHIRFVALPYHHPNVLRAKEYHSYLAAGQRENSLSSPYHE